jgi:hypothetical protein
LLPVWCRRVSNRFPKSSGRLEVAIDDGIELTHDALEEPRLRAIGLAKHDVSDRPETRIFPCVEESIDLRPAVEHDRYPVLPQHSVRFPHRGFEPVRLRIVLNGASAAVEVRSLGTIPNRAESIRKLIKKRSPRRLRRTALRLHSRAPFRKRWHLLCYFGNITQLIETRRYGPHCTQLNA